MSTQDNMLGIDGNRDMLVMNDALSVFKAAYLLPDKKADSTADAIKHFKGKRKYEILYCYRSGEIERALRDLHIVSDTCQLGVPQNSAVAERLVQDVLEGTRTALLLGPGSHQVFGSMRASILA